MKRPQRKVENKMKKGSKQMISEKKLECLEVAADNACAISFMLHDMPEKNVEESLEALCSALYAASHITHSLMDDLRALKEKKELLK